MKLWPKEMTELLIELYQKGYSYIQICDELNKKFKKQYGLLTVRSIESKLRRLFFKKVVTRRNIYKGNFDSGVLSDQHKKIIELWKQNKSLGEISELLNVSRGAVCSTIRKFKKQLKTADVLDKANQSTKGLEKYFLALLRQRPYSIGELSRILDRSKETIIKLIDKLYRSGYEIEFDKASKQVVLSKDVSRSAQFKPLDFNKFYRHEFKIGIISDTQFGSKYQCLSLVKLAYLMFEKEKVDFVVHAGDVVDGRDVYSGQISETFLYDADEIKEYVLMQYPYSKNFKTYMIAGNHDFSFKKKAGYNIVRDICESSLRDDLIYRGTDTIFDVKGLKIQLLHPSGGLAYSISYRPQKIVSDIVANAVQLASFQQNKVDIPKLIVMGHFHKYVTFMYGGSTVISAPAMQSQTPYLRDKGLTPDVGCLIIKIVFDKNWNMTKIIPEVFLFNHLIKSKDY